jgi:hypothetical protein
MKLASLNGDDSYVTELEVDFARTRETMEARLWDEARGYYISWHDPGHRAWDGTERAHGEKSENSMIASLAGVWYAAMLDLGPILDPVRVRSALTKLYERNVKPVRYCAANEARPDGTSSFSWPFYAENYFAANAIYHGQSDNGLEMVRKFYEAAFVKSRSPWNIPLNWAGEENGEPEWGKWYMTNPSSWTVLLALSGVRYNAFDKSLVIEPNVPESLGELRGVPVFMPRFRARVTDTGNVGSFKVDKIIGADRLSVRALGLRVNGAKSIRLNGAELDLARDERATEAVRYVGVLELEAGDEITWTQTEAPAS